MNKDIETIATIINKRSAVSGLNTVYTTYYVTFRTQDNQRLEFKVDGETSGKLLIGDYGYLVYNKNRFVHFKVNTEMDLNYKNEHGMSALHIAVLDNDIYNASRLLVLGKSANENDNYQYTPLNYAIENNNTEMVKLLVSNGGRTNVLANKNHPINIAFHNENYEIIRILLDTNIDLNAKSSNSKSALSYAIQKNKVDIVKLLIHKGININSTIIEHDGTPLMQALRYHTFTESEIEKIIKKVKLDFLESPITSDIIEFTREYHPNKEIINILLDAGADISIKNNKGISAADLMDDFRKNIFALLNIK